MAQENGQTIRRFAVLLAVLPVLTSLLAYTLVFSYQDLGMTEAARQYGKSTARLVARQVARPVVEDDVLSLNVIAKQLAEAMPVLSVSIYNDADQLVVQSGQTTRGGEYFSSEVTFQDSVVGFVRVKVARVEQDLAVPAMLLVLFNVIWIAFVVWRASALFRWVSGLLNTPSTVEDEPDSATSHAAPEQPEYVEAAVLIARIRPAHTLTRYFNRFFRAAKLYGGIIEQTTPEELVIHFEGPDAIYLSVCAGLLLQRVANDTPGKIDYGAVLTAAEDSDKNRKFASYLASVSEGDLLFSKRDLTLDDRVSVSNFHHSLIDSDDLIKVTGLTEQKLLDAQVQQLLAEPL